MSSTNAWHCKLSCCHPSGQSTHRRSLDLLNAVIVIKCMWQEFSTHTWDFTIPSFQAGEQSQVICRQFRRSLHRRNKRKLRLNTQTCAFMSFLRRLAIFLACFADSRNCSLIAFLCCFRALISTHSTCRRSRRKEGHEEKVDFFTRCIICTSFIQCRENINWKACQLVLVHRACPKCIQSEAPVPDPQNHSCFSLVHLGLPSLCPVSDGRVHYS